MAFLQKLITYLSLLLLLVGLIYAYWQPSLQDDRIETFFADLAGTPFLATFDSVAHQLETETTSLKKLSPSIYTIEDMAAIELGYLKSAQKMDAILYSIKDDLTTPAKLKTVLTTPAAFASSYRTRLNEAVRHQNEHFAVIVGRINMRHEIMTNPSLFSRVLEGGMGLVGLVESLNNQSKTFSDQLFEENLIAPHRMEKWSDL